MCRFSIPSAMSLRFSFKSKSYAREQRGCFFMKQGVLLLSQLFLLLLLYNDLLHKCSFILASRIRLIVLIGLIFVC